VFFDINIGGQTIGKIIMELYKDITPKSAENFHALCTGEKITKSGTQLHYKNTKFHRIIPKFMCQGGDLNVAKGNSDVISIFGQSFEDENFIRKHLGPGILSMANSGPNTNGSQFFLCLVAIPWLDNKHVVFGQVHEGYNVLKAMEVVGSNSGNVKKSVIIIDCGQIT
jgi:peptidylprolyl isomerase